MAHRRLAPIHPGEVLLDDECAHQAPSPRALLRPGRTCAQAIDGRANDALVGYLAQRLDLPRRAVQIASGHASRRKLLDVTGIDVTDAARRLLGPGESND